MLDETPKLSVEEALRVLRGRLSEPAPGRIQVLSGPRQVGKTTLLLGLSRELGEKALYVAADGPEASLPGFWERSWQAAVERAVRLGGAVLLIDEAHLFPRWDTLLKGEWDRVSRLGQPLHVVISGSSALRLAVGTRESLAGRFETLALTHWTAAAIARAFGVGLEAAVDALVATGSYPGAFPLRADPGRWRAYVRDAIVEPAVGRDVLALEAVRKPGLLRQVFGACLASPAQVVSLQKLQGLLQDRGALETLAHYLTLLQQAGLVAALERFSARALRERAAPPKLVVLNNAFLAAAETAGSPTPTSDPSRFGAWVENACLAHAWNAGQRVRYWREASLEVDGVLDGTWGRWALAVKAGPFGPADLRGLAEFTRRFPEYRPLVLCAREHQAHAGRLALEAMSWRDFLATAGPRAVRG